MAHQFEKIGIFGNFKDGRVRSIHDRIALILDENGTPYRTHLTLIHEADWERDVKDEEIDLAIIVGGDGTFLNISRALAGFKAPVLGVNVGRRGFLTDVEVGEIVETMQLLLNGDYAIEPRSLLSASIIGTDGKLDTCLALNDIVVHKTNYGRLIDFEITVDGTFVTSLRADGVIVATPTGSTAYALSSGGPVLHPKLPAIEVVPISPHTLTHRPIVLNETSVIEINLINAAPGNASLVVDGHVRQDLDGEERISINSANLPVHFVRILGHDFYNALRQKLGWGV